MLFRVSGGVYSQPPFYKELRNFNGEIIPNIKAQKSIHMVLGGDYSFTIWERPFKLTIVELQEGNKWIKKVRGKGLLNAG